MKHDNVADRPGRTVARNVLPVFDIERNLQLTGDGPIVPYSVQENQSTDFEVPFVSCAFGLLASGCTTFDFSERNCSLRKLLRKLWQTGNFVLQRGGRALPLVFGHLTRPTQMKKPLQR
ncbi:hypothetical protein Mp_Vg00120 [Marchantia polymorpha subsp. ruderalis]|uniref:Uncharacterized protein n=1 Tax=Marchantia polymorpha TaxID=3197 RepID=A0A2R6VWW3_MARPO|nr:hypothetical protein MARPO_YB0038 [Marchantia polymorpha]BBN20455.1 hypothetical protein Mp_Vg00120 [Marchantia polymorpha subsp. ruderalis]|eukprot:PTQ26097.1 hypothetical protein MARPO_YB0038 [Marchantia polymorpha]